MIARASGVGNGWASECSLASSSMSSSLNRSTRVASIWPNLTKVGPRRSRVRRRRRPSSASEVSRLAIAVSVSAVSLAAPSLASPSLASPSLASAAASAFAASRLSIKKPRPSSMKTFVISAMRPSFMLAAHPSKLSAARARPSC